MKRTTLKTIVYGWPNILTTILKDEDVVLGPKVMEKRQTEGPETKEETRISAGSYDNN